MKKLIQRLLPKIEEYEYTNIAGSRRVVKSIEGEEITSAGFYSVDIWSQALEKYKHSLKSGISLYLELAGYCNQDKFIQKSYDYGEEKGCFSGYVYRITYTNASGDIFELTTPQMLKYCERNGLKTVPILYYGKAKDLFPELDINNHWNENFLQKLSEKYLEKKCHMCKSDVWAEGVVINVQSDVFEPLKLKSYNFLNMEEKELESGAENIEDSA